LATLKKQRVAHWAVASLTVINAAWIAYHYTTRTNSLYRHPDWRSSKVALSRSVFGALSYVVSPIPLSSGALDLGAWHGFQEVVFERDVAPSTIRFRLRLAPHAWVALIFGRAAGRSHGIVLGTDEPPRYFTAAEDGRFTEQHTFGGSPLVAPRVWHGVDFHLSGSSASIRLDSVVLATFSAPAEIAGRIGFRGGYEQALVDDVEVLDGAGSIAIRESFFNSSGFVVAFVFVGLAFAALAVAVSKVYGRSRANGAAVLRWTTLQISVALSIAVYSLASRSDLIAPSYPDELPLDGYDIQTFPSEMPDDFAQRREWYRARLPAGVRTVALLGGSQTWGAGALDDDGVLEAYVTRDLQTAVGPCVVAVNLGKAGGRLRELLPDYEQHWASLLNPSLVIANVGINDRDDLGVLEAAVRALAAFNRNRGIPTALALEAFSTEARFSSPSREEIFLRTQATHERLRSLGAELAIPVWDAHEHLTSRASSGFLWWDFFHLTSYGQELLAAFLAKRAMPLLPECDVVAGGARGS
jgi:lysophospholipase L1-like esterase